MSEIELKACPFCGSTDIRHAHHGGASYTVWCGHCWASSPHETTPTEAAECWNRRPSDASRTGREEEGGILPPSSSEAHEPTGWRTMDSAPKDGTKILVHRPAASTRRIVAIDWWDVEYGKWWISPPDTQPAHWRPLPAPPVLVTQPGAVGPSSGRVATPIDKQEER